MNVQDKDMLLRAANEIESLRRSNEIMHARLEMFDDMMRVLHAVPPPNQTFGMSIDVAQELRKALVCEPDIR